MRDVNVISQLKSARQKGNLGPRADLAAQMRETGNANKDGRGHIQHNILGRILVLLAVSLCEIHASPASEII